MTRPDYKVTEEPIEEEPDEDWEHRELYDRVKEALFALPSYFNSEIFLEGIQAEDVFALNSVLAPAVEDTVVETLNSMRSVWDADDEYSDCSFVRQSQTFPDVVLVRHIGQGKKEPIMGIELKNWYLLSKEEEPSARFKTTVDACAKQDLLAVFTWSLDNVITGSPVLYEPYVTSAIRASNYVDYYWQTTRNTDLDTTIERPEGITPYPSSKSDEIHDDPVSDSGNNYGRLARSRIPDFDNYKEKMLNKKLSGIRAEEWIEFLKTNGRDEQTEIIDFDMEN